MGLFDAPTPTPVELKGTSQQVAPQYLTDYLTNLAQAGQGALGTTSAEGTMTPFTGDQLIAGLPQNLQDLYEGAIPTLQRYQTPMDESLTALQDASKGVSPTDISQFYDPYEKDVVDEMSRQSLINTQQNLLPALRGAFAGSGGFGSQRYAGAAGQALSNVQNDLLGQQTKFRSEGYKSALDAALKDRGYDIQVRSVPVRSGSGRSSSSHYWLEGSGRYWHPAVGLRAVEARSAAYPCAKHRKDLAGLPVPDDCEQD
jgi:hypothetical protein